MQDLGDINREFDAHLTVMDPAFIGGGWFHEASDIPVALLNVHPMGLSSRDTAPTNLGLLPSTTPLGDLEPRAELGDPATCCSRCAAALERRAHERRPAPDRLVHDTAAQAELYCSSRCRASSIRAAIPIRRRTSSASCPCRRHRARCRPRGRAISQGSRPGRSRHAGHRRQRTSRPDRATIAGLADEDVLVVATTGGRPVEQLSSARCPTTRASHTFLPYAELLPRTSLMVTNGGYGGTQLGLSHGLPIVVAGTSEDKTEVSARVAWTGAGINLKTEMPTPAQVRERRAYAARRPQRYRRRAQALRTEYARYDAVARGVELIERLAATGAARAAR